MEHTWEQRAEAEQLKFPLPHRSSIDAASSSFPSGISCGFLWGWGTSVWLLDLDIPSIWGLSKEKKMRHSQRRACFALQYE